MTRNSRLPLNPSTNLPSINSFGELSQFLRSSVADEDSRLLSDSMSQLAAHVEAIIAALRMNQLLTAEDFELVAWRTLGEGMLMIDMYEQWISREGGEPSALGALSEPQVERAVQWWKKLRL